MPLAEIALRKLKPGSKPFKLFDKEGLFMLVQPNGRKLWRFKYRFLGKEKALALGAYPEVSLAEARKKRGEARALLRDGIDPAEKKKEDKRQAVFNVASTFRAVALEWHAANRKKWTEDHALRLQRRMERHLFPKLGDRPVKDIVPLDVLDVLRKVEKQGATHLPRRLLQVSRAIFRYAIITGRAEHNAAGDLQGALSAHRETHYPTIPASDLPHFLAALETVKATGQNRLAVKLLLHTFVRQGELRRAKWADIDVAKREWDIPAQNTKMRERHTVPLTLQTLELLGQLRDLTGWSAYLFPSQNRRKHPIMSENTINKVLRQMGYKGKLVGHGFRALASTTLNEMGFAPDVIERQLAHCERNKVRAAYNRAEYLPQRREMMQRWSDLLDQQQKDPAADVQLLTSAAVG